MAWLTRAPVLGGDKAQVSQLYGHQEERSNGIQKTSEFTFQPWQRIGTCGLSLSSTSGAFPVPLSPRFSPRLFSQPHNPSLTRSSCPNCLIPVLILCPHKSSPHLSWLFSISSFFLPAPLWSRTAPLPPPTAIPASFSFSLCCPHLLPSAKWFEIPCAVCALTKEGAWERSSQPGPWPLQRTPQKAASTPGQEQRWQCGILATNPLYLTRVISFFCYKDLCLSKFGFVLTGTGKDTSFFTKTTVLVFKRDTVPEKNCLCLAYD